MKLIETGSMGACRIFVSANTLMGCIRLVGTDDIQLSNPGERNDKFNVRFLYPSLFELCPSMRNVRLCLSA